MAVKVETSLLNRIWYEKFNDKWNTGLMVKLHTKVDLKK